MQLKENETFWSILAFLRFFLASVVFVAHLSFFVNLPPELASFKELGGKAAVLGFLLISGVSIGHSYKARQDGFLSRRFLRIYPLYFFAVLFTIFLQSWLGSPYPVTNTAFVAAGVLTSIANFFFLQDFLAITLTYNGPLWSLAVEVFYYILTPLFSKIKSQFILILILLSLLTYLFYGHKQWSWGFDGLRYAWPWLTGFLLAYKGINRWVLLTLLTAGIYSTFAVLSKSGDGIFSHYNFAFIAVSLFTVSRVTFRLPVAVKKLFNYLGDLSYPLYVFHFPLYLTFFYFGIRNAYFFFGLLVVCILPINYLFDNLLKKIFWKPFVKRVNAKVEMLTIKLKFNAKRYLSRS